MWTFLAYLTSREQDKVVGVIYGYVMPGQTVHSVKKILPIYNHAEDVTWVDGQSYIRKPPVWEEELENWLKEQEEFEKTFDSKADYVRHMQVTLALTE